MGNNLKHKQFGLVGKNIEYSFSKIYFEKKFSKNKNYTHFNYENFDIKNISEIKDIYRIKNLSGLNITIPYKEKIIPYLDHLTPTAQKIGAVNTVIFKNDKTIGDNTDVIGFERALEVFVGSFIKKALVLGSGGASKAIEYVLRKNRIDLIIVSRNPNKNEINYIDLNQELINNYPLIINCTPLGTFPKIEGLPKIPYDYINSKNYLFDLIYNPKETKFMKKGIDKGANVCNGHNMLIQQAEASWKLWK
jgi:shikimate dehydrogenase